MYSRGKLFRSMLAIGTVLAGVVAGATVLAQPAVATVPGLQQAFGESQNPGARQQQAFVMCPVGQKIYRGGAQVLAGGDEKWITITELAPSNSLRTLWATAAVHTAAPVNSGWILRVNVWCGPSQPVHVLSPVVSSANDSSSEKGAVASCPTGTVSYGGFGRIVNSAGGAAFTTMVSNEGTGASVRANSLVNRPPPGAWYVQAMAICATPLPGYRVIPNSSTSNQDPHRGVSAPCPLNQNLEPVGGGFTISGNPGRVVLVNQMVDRRRSEARAAAVSTGSAWHVTAEVICA